MTTVKFGVTQKRINSTSVTMTDTIDLDCRLKEPCSIHDPVFIVQGLTKLKRYNYLFWNSAHYWIDNITFISNDICEVNAHLDPLASFRGHILNEYGLVLFGDNTHKTVYKDDIRFGPDRKLLFSAGSGASGYVSMGLNFNSATVIVVAQASTSFAYSGITTYAMTVSTYVQMLKNFSGVVYSDIQSWSGTDVIDVIKNYAMRILTGGQQALDNIISATLVPIPYSTFQASAYSENSSIELGPYSITLDSGTVCVVNPHDVTDGNAVLNLNRPLPNTTYKWLNGPKYCQIQLTHPCGYTDINTPALMELNQAYLWWSLHRTTGEYCIRITSEPSKDSDTLTFINGTVGVDVLYLKTASGSTNDSNLHNSIGSALIQGGTGGVIQYNPGTQIPASSGRTIPSGLAGMKLLDTGKEIFYDVEYYQPAIFEGNTATMYNSFCSQFGYPVDKYMKIGDISGYCQCNNVSIGNITGATEADKVTINNYLNSGIYIE